jgi:deoxyribodipyrimidine photolyase-related protein
MAATVFLVFPHQLFKTLFTVPKTIPFCFIEDSRYFREVPYHAHNLVLKRASMQATRERLLVKGFQVQYFDTVQYPTLSEVFAELAKQGVREFQYYETVDHVLEAEVTSLAQKHGIHATCLQSPGFLTEISWVTSYYAKHKKKGFSDFYKALRLKLNLLIKDSKPISGAWIVPIPETHELPATVPHVHIPEHNRYVDEAILYVKEHFPQAEGNPEHAVFPVTYADSEDWLENFIQHRLSYYAQYYTAVSDLEGMLFHAGISPLMNAGLLMPQQVVEAVLAFHKIRPLPLPSLEMFLQMAVGRREWLRMQYMTQCASHDLQALLKLPSTFPAVVKPILKRVKALGYCHHVERVALYKALQAQKASQSEVYSWFKSMFLDSADWALLPFILLPDVNE